MDVGPVHAAAGHRSQFLGARVEAHPLVIRRGVGPVEVRGLRLDMVENRGVDHRHAHQFPDRRIARDLLPQGDETPGLHRMAAIPFGHRDVVTLQETEPHAPRIGPTSEGAHPPRPHPRRPAGRMVEVATRVVRGLQQCEQGPAALLIAPPRLIQAAAEAERVVKPDLGWPCLREEHALHERHDGVIERCLVHRAGPSEFLHRLRPVGGEDFAPQFLRVALQRHEQPQFEVEFPVCPAESAQRRHEPGRIAGPIGSDGPPSRRRQSQGDTFAFHPDREVPFPRRFEAPLRPRGGDLQGQRRRRPANGLPGSLDPPPPILLPHRRSGTGDRVGCRRGGRGRRGGRAQPQADDHAAPRTPGIHAR
jgi:hypothetical protein